MRTSRFVVFSVFCVVVFGFSVVAQAQQTATPPDAFKTLVGAMKQQDVAKVKEVLGKQPDLAKAKDEKGATPLHLLAGMGLVAPKPGAPPTVPATPADKEAALKARDETLKKAAATQQEIAKALLDKGADVNAQDAAGNTALLTLLMPASEAMPLKPGQEAPDTDQMKEALQTQQATVANRKDMVSLLLQKGADVNVQDKTGATPLHKVVAVPAPAAPKVAPANPADAEKLDEMRKKIMEQQLGIADMLVKKGADVRAKDKAGATPQAKAEAAKRQDMLDLLMKTMQPVAPAPTPQTK